MKKNLLKIYGFILILLQSAVIAGCDNDDKNSTMNSSLANLGDFYYSDGTWSSNLNSHKEVIGIVFGISKEKGGEVLPGLTKGQHGRVVALKNINVDGNEWLYWGEYGGNKEVPKLTKHATMDGANYYYFINTDNPSNWQTGAISDWNGAENTLMILKYRGERVTIENKPSDYPAASFCHLYGNNDWAVGKPGEWYLPACGEAALIYARREMTMNKFKECNGQWFGSYLWTSTAFDWKTNEGKHDITENLSGSSWTVYFTYGMIAWPTRDRPKPVRPVMAF